jgi:hypothetical protein
VGGDPIAEVYPLAPRDERPDRQPLPPEELWWLRRGPLERTLRPPGPPPAPRGLVLRRWPAGRVTADGFPAEADVAEARGARLPPALAAAVRLERGRLYVEAATGAAVDVPVGASPRPGCRRSGRLYLRPAGR